MRVSARAIVFAVVVAATVVGARPAFAQAWVLPAGSGAITVVTQEIDHVGRLHDDGSRTSDGQFVNLGFDAELDYALTDRWSITTSLPFIAAKYTDANPPPSFIPFTAIDSCRCWQSGFSDFGLTSRYNLVNHDRAFMLTPFVSVGVPTHSYEYDGEAVLGRRLKQLRVGTAAGQRLDWPLRGLAAEASYSYTAVPKVLDMSSNRSNGTVAVSYTLRLGLSASAIASWQRTHGGLRGPEIAGFPDRIAEFQRLMRDNYLQTGYSVSFAHGAWDVSASYLWTERGTNTHDVNVYSATVSRLFEFHRQH